MPRALSASVVVSPSGEESLLLAFEGARGGAERGRGLRARVCRVRWSGVLVGRGGVGRDATRAALLLGSWWIPWVEPVVGGETQ